MNKEQELKEFKKERDPTSSTSFPYINADSSINEFNNFSKNIENESNQIKSILDDGESVIGNTSSSNIDENDLKLRKYFENSKRLHLENGNHSKKMGVSFNNLTVVGLGADSSLINDMITPFRTLLKTIDPRNWRKKINTFNILQDVNGFCKDGEMLLVLGRPGSGCSTLLRILSNNTTGYVSIDGDISYGGIPSKEFKKFRGEAIYTPEEDSHHPTLTLRETLDFALKCKTPSIDSRLKNETKLSFRTKVFDLLLSMFGIVHQADTMVGNEFVRGLSGGERKRLTITEAMVSSASIVCWDCSTRGLDAASAFDYGKSLRIMSDTLHKTTISSFYQASDSIYKLFDNVLILEKGKCIYFGPVGMAKQYFQDLGFDCEPRKSIPDFLTGVTNFQERIIIKGYEETAPKTSMDFENAWKSSNLFREMKDKQEQYEREIQEIQPSIQFIKEIKNENSNTNFKNSIYKTSFTTQVMALIKRNFNLITGDKFGMFSKYLSLIIQAVIQGSMFYNLPPDLSGLFTRGGALLFAITFNAFLTFGEMFACFVGRRVLQKHKTYALYRPSAFHIAQVVTDIPVIIIQTLIYSIIAYFLIGLELSASKFFIFLFTIIGSSLACTALFRLFGNICPSLYIAQNFSNAVLIMMFIHAGYSIPINKMPTHFSWFIHINIFIYAFKALMANEFVGKQFNCYDSAIPYGPSYNSTNEYRICPTVGAIQGELTFSGQVYMDKTLSFPDNEMSQNIIIVYCWWIFLVICNMIALEVLDHTSGGFSHKLYKKGQAPKMNDIEEEKKLIEIVAKASDNMKDTLSMDGGVFTWSNINYIVPSPIKGNCNLLLLDNVSGYIKPGQMTALMGSSGAGKTTLLDVLAKRKTLGSIEGECYLNGKPLEIDFERITGYVEQMDVHNPGLTVREALQFSAKLRQKQSIPIKEKFEYVEHVLEMMEMKHLGGALIGSLETGIGISVEERKRLTIGVELVAKPKLLFLDEPTSGLDAQSSYNIIKFIRKLADSGMPLVCTIHQPSSVLFEYFDRILLLAKGGKTVYFGDIGERSSTLTSYFERQGVRHCTDSENPAEYILEATGAGVYGSTDHNWPEIWKQSNEYLEIERELNTIKTSQHNLIGVDEQSSNKGGDETLVKPIEFASSIGYQTFQVYKRLNLIWFRDPYYTNGSFIQAIIVGLLVGFTYYDLKDSSSDMNQRIFFVLQAVMLAILLIFSSMAQFATQREYFKRDYACKFYSWFPFALSIALVELPFIIASGTIFYCCSYTLGIELNFYFWLVYILFLIFCVTFGQAVAAVCDVTMAITVIPVLIVILFLFCGIMVPPNDIPTFYRYFLYQVNPTRYFMEGILTNILQHTNVKCSPDDLIKFSFPPQFNSCDNYVAQFNQYATGYVVSNVTLPNGSYGCGYCIYENGKEYYQTLGWSEENKGRNIGILIAFICTNITLIVFFVYLKRKPLR